MLKFRGVVGYVPPGRTIVAVVRTPGLDVFRYLLHLSLWVSMVVCWVGRFWPPRRMVFLSTLKRQNPTHIYPEPPRVVLPEQSLL